VTLRISVAYSGTITVRVVVPQAAQPEQADMPLQLPQLLQPQLLQAQAFAAESSRATTGKMTDNRCFIKPSSFTKILKSAMEIPYRKFANQAKVQYLCVCGKEVECAD
jgi:hypothetical protein